MDLELEPGPFRQLLRRAFRIEHRGRSGCGRGEESRQAALRSGLTRLPLVRIRLAARLLDEHDDVVHRFRGLGADFHRRHPFVLVEMRLRVRVLVLHNALRWHLECVGCRDDGVWRSDVPPFHELPRARRIVRIAFRRAIVRPHEQIREVARGERTVVGPFTNLPVREPGRHASCLRHVLDGGATIGDLPVGVERHWGIALGTVTALAVLRHQPTDTVVVRDWSFLARRRLIGGKHTAWRIGLPPHQLATGRHTTE